MVDPSSTGERATELVAGSPRPTVEDRTGGAGSGRHRGSTKTRRWIAWLVAAAVGFGAGYWAARQTLSPPESPLGEAGSLTYTVVNGEVGQSLDLAAVAE